MNKIYMRCNKGVWVASTVFYGVEVVCTSESLRASLRGIQTDMKYIESNLYRQVLREETA